MSQQNAEQLQNDCFRRMAPGERLALSMKLYWSARQLKAADLRAQHPDWPEEKIQAEVRELFLYANT